MKKIDPLPKKLERFAPAVKALQKFLLAQEKDCDPKMECMVYCWGTAKHGIRIAEISYWVPSGKKGMGAGASHMRSEPECGDVILAAEDFLLTFFDKPYRPKGWESDIDEHADAKWKLEQVLAEQAAEPVFTPDEERELVLLLRSAKLGTPVGDTLIVPAERLEVCQKAVSRVIGADVLDNWENLRGRFGKE